jgi:hypothetical protein
MMALEFSLFKAAFVIFDYVEVCHHGHVVETLADASPTRRAKALGAAWGQSKDRSRRVLEGRQAPSACW